MGDDFEFQDAMDEAYEGWKDIQHLDEMSIRDVYECAFRHGVEAAQCAVNHEEDHHV